MLITGITMWKSSSMRVKERMMLKLRKEIRKIKNVRVCFSRIKKRGSRDLVI